MSKVIEIRQKGDFKKSLTFFSHINSWSVRPILEKYGKLGVERLADATPKATGKTAFLSHNPNDMKQWHATLSCLSSTA